MQTARIVPKYTLSIKEGILYYDYSKINNRLQSTRSYISKITANNVITFLILADLNSLSLFNVLDLTDLQTPTVSPEFNLLNIDFTIQEIKQLFEKQGITVLNSQKPNVQNTSYTFNDQVNLEYQNCDDLEIVENGIQSTKILMGYKLNTDEIYCQYQMQKPFVPVYFTEAIQNYSIDKNITIPPTQNVVPYLNLDLINYEQQPQTFMSPSYYRYLHYLEFSNDFGT